MTTIGSRLAAIRVARGLTQRQVADLLGVISNQVARWERGAGIPRVPMLIAIARYFDIDLHWLLTGKHWTPTVPERS